MSSNVTEFFSKLKFGETVLVEYSSTSYPELFLSLTVKYAQKSGLDVLVDDILDTYPQFLTRLKLLNIDVPEVGVIKIGGGRLEGGHVVGRLDIDKYSVPLGHYSVLSERSMGEKKYINPVVGLHKLAYILNRREILALLTSLSSFIGNESRIALYLVNEPLIGKVDAGLIEMFEEIATTVVTWTLEGDELVLRVLKAADPELVGKEYMVQLKELLQEG